MNEAATPATDQAFNQVEIKWLKELEAGDKFKAVFALRDVKKDLENEFIGDPCKVDIFLKLLSQTQEFPISAAAEKARKDFFMDCFEDFLEESSIQHWVDSRLELVSHGDPIKWFYLIPVGYPNLEFKYPVAKGEFIYDLLILLTEKLGVVWWRRKSDDLMRLTAKNYKTPRQFGVDESLPLRAVNRAIKAHWDFLQDDLGSIRLSFPGADPIILLPPKAQKFLKNTCTVGGRMSWMVEMAELSDSIKALGDEPLFN